MNESVDSIVKPYFEACELGKGWELCKVYCHPEATFEAQLKDVKHLKTLEAYSEFIKGLFLTTYKNLTYEIKSWLSFQNQVVAYAVFKEMSIETDEVEETDGNLLNNDRKEEKLKNKKKMNNNPVLFEYVYVIDLEDGKVCNMTKIEDKKWAMEELGWEK